MEISLGLRNKELKIHKSLSLSLSKKKMKVKKSLSIGWRPSHDGAGN